MHQQASLMLNDVAFYPCNPGNRTEMESLRNVLETRSAADRYGKMKSSILIMLAVSALFAAGSSRAAEGTDKNGTTAQDGRPVVNTVNKAGEIVSQPVRDVGASKREIPSVLEGASENPYATTGVRTCSQIATAMKDLNEVLGPDYVAGSSAKENKAGKLAEAGGKTVVNTLIPFRGLVREISGAAPAERRYNAALDAGLVRRGFLRGLAFAKGCKL